MSDSISFLQSVALGERDFLDRPGDLNNGILAAKMLWDLCRTNHPEASGAVRHLAETGGYEGVFDYFAFLDEHGIMGGANWDDYLDWQLSREIEGN